MKTFIVFSAVVACAVAAPGAVLLNSLVSSPLALGRTVSIGAPLAYAQAVQVVAPAVTSSQYHAQDELGQYSYGYAGGPSAKSEVKTVDGVTRGGYSYVDANGVVQTVNYVSDALGFRVAATNLPVAPVAPVVPQLVGPAPVQETPEVAAARAAHLNAVAQAAAAAAAAPDN